MFTARFVWTAQKLPIRVPLPSAPASRKLFRVLYYILSWNKDILVIFLWKKCDEAVLHQIESEGESITRTAGSILVCCWSGNVTYSYNNFICLHALM